MMSKVLKANLICLFSLLFLLSCKDSVSEVVEVQEIIFGTAKLTGRTLFGFEAIPSYLLFNKEGVLVKKFTAFPENEEVKKMIDEQLDKPN